MPSAQMVSQAADYAEFETRFCAADHGKEHIFVLPVAILNDEKGVTCDNGESMFRTAERTGKIRISIASTR